MYIAYPLPSIKHARFVFKKKVNVLAKSDIQYVQNKMQAIVLVNQKVWVINAEIGNTVTYF